MEHQKYVESGLWDGHFRDAASREGLVLRSEASALAQRPGRFGVPLRPRWPFRPQNRASASEMPWAPGGGGTLPGPAAGPAQEPARESAHGSPHKGSPRESLREELLSQLSAYRQLADQRVATMRARLIKCPDAATVEELEVLRAEVAQQIASLEEAAHKAARGRLHDDAPEESPK
ncbi:unnamed protein product [Symbiodinium natans]|uniref:Uncharacterized protein n=1 Tax=Symbiodinium natans TaxID=878477 RepID=A0A812PU09_9DINO|nr:unnamed protein product [Symbiodinium natans]